MNDTSRVAAALGLALCTVVSISAAHALGGKQEGGGDWPCPQRKVTSLGASDLQWDGAPIETGKAWRQDSDVAGLVKQLANRRVAQDDAVKSLKAYAEKVAPAERPAKLAVVFAGLLETVNEYRSSVISGIERFNKRQRSRATEIEEEGTKLNDLQKKAEADPKDEKANGDYQKALELYEWNTRVFEERRTNLPLACEIPPAIDSRVFEIVREIRLLMGQPG
jgi:hypothetical protein